MSRASIEHARAAVEAQKARCRKAFTDEQGIAVVDIMSACWGFHTEVQKLHQLQADLANLERNPTR